ncbi:MAG: type II toxin-antitoxin system RelE/ParE family toxin [Flavobacteriales bacterium]|nr:type II toxin-antitoxin system RelE/ParE family toxin [Flavobacteriales bacterium]
MNYSVELTDNFKKEAKRLVKKYKSLKAEISALVIELETSPTMGIALGNDIYKIRLAVKSKGKGKSGGVRIMSYVKITDTEVLLFSIFNKGDQDSISDKEIKALLKEI